MWENRKLWTMITLVSALILGAMSTTEFFEGAKWLCGVGSVIMMVYFVLYMEDGKREQES